MGLGSDSCADSGGCRDGETRRRRGAPDGGATLRGHPTVAGRPVVAAAAAPGAPRCTAGQKADAAKAMVAIALRGLPRKKRNEARQATGEAGAGKEGAKVRVEVGYRCTRETTQHRSHRPSWLPRAHRRDTFSVNQCTTTTSRCVINVFDSCTSILRVSEHLSLIISARCEENISHENFLTKQCQ